MAPKRGLGRGLSNLIPTDDTTEDVTTKTSKQTKTGTVTKTEIVKKVEQTLNINRIEPNKNQPRKEFNEDALQELADSIKQFGVIEPLVVVKRKGYYELIAGERRWRAARLAGLKEVPVVIKDYDDQQIVEIALIENIQREDLNPIDVAGCPPDAFSEDGQLWGNPLFRWDVMKKDSYSWWTKRISAMAKLYDIVRIDHFRGFDSFYAIPAKDDTAKNGVWKDGPGMDLFNVLEKKLGKLPIIVEDLGFLTPSVKKLLKDSGFPGMKVIQFAFDSREDSDYLPHNYPQHCVVYTGTHDNDTVMGWMKTAPKDCVRFAKDYLNLTKEEGYNWGMMRAAWSSVADMAIVPMQDLLGLDSKARINIPSTTGGNWQWRATPEQIDNKLAKKLHKCMQMYARLREEPEEASDKSDAKETADTSTSKTAGCEKKAAK